MIKLLSCPCFYYSSLMVLTGALVLWCSGAFAQADSGKDLDSFQRRDTSFYSTFYKKQVYDQFVGSLEPSRLIDRIRKPRALDLNAYDEVADSSFFINRQGKKPLSQTELENAPLASQDPGPSPEGPWTIFKGKTDGVTPGFFIKDGKGQKFLLKFDPRSNPEMTTAAEMIGHKFFYAFGYNVPSYSLVYFKPEVLAVSTDATYYDKNGFKHPLTIEKALEMLRKDAPLMKGGLYRASASRLLIGKLLGYFDYEKNRQDEPSDSVPHDKLRALRALRVFGSWTNNYDLHRKNTMDVVADENGQEVLKHYLLDFGSCFGSSGFRPKVPAVGFENIVDYHEVTKAVGFLKTNKKPWEKRWDKNNRQVPYPSIGYFDNLEFNPGNWKTNLPHEAFRQMTDADGYWAAKVINSFSDEDIATLVKTGRLSSKTAEKYLVQTLIERRDLVVRHWFSKVSPLEDFYIQKDGGVTRVSFNDLSVQKGWAPNRSYTFCLYSLSEKGNKKLVEKGTSETASVSLANLPASEEALLAISAVDGKKKHSPAKVTFDTASLKVLSIEH